jgi:ligand-binding sensor domain-containing protein/signal transduction histidine kinase
MFAPTVRSWNSAAIIFFLVSGWLRAAAATELDSGWSSRVWQTEDDLPAANVAGIAQTHDGYLWLATQAGLARFDGVEFEVVPIPIGRARPIIRVMLCDHAENFWLAEDGGVVIRFGTATPQMFTVTNGLPNALVLQMVETPDHNIWISYADGSVFRITPQNRVVRLTSADGLNDDGTGSLTLDVRGVLWFAKGFQFGFWSRNRFVIAGAMTERNPQILGCRNGGLWFCTSSQLLKYGSNAAPVAVANFSGEASRLRPSVMFEDFSGRVWVGTVADGLFQLDHTNLFKIVTSQNRIRTIIRDREGSIWVGTDGGGLNRLRPRAVELRGRNEGLPFETVRSLSEDLAGNLWVVTQDGTVTTLPGEDWDSGQKLENWPGGIAHCVVTDKNGAVWIGTYQRGLFCWKDGKFLRFTTQNGLGGPTVRSLLVDSRNDLWIGLETSHLVQRLHEGQFQSFELPADCRAVRAIAEDSNGEIWLGTLDGRLFCVNGAKLLEVPSPVSESMHAIRCLTATPDGSLWIGYAVKGVSRLKAGRLSPIGSKDGLFEGNICAIMPDEYGRMWFASDRGIFYVSCAQLNDFADGRTAHVQSIFFGRDTGLPSLEAYYGYWPGALRMRNGEILFPTHSGVAVVSPDRVHPNIMPPQVKVKSLMIDGQIVAPGKNGALPKLPPGHRRIEIAFTAPSFVGPEQVRFRYRLEGWNDEWSEAATTRMAVFSRLPPGDYTFQVTACNSYGVWNERSDLLTFSVAPFFWQSWPFRILIALFCLTVIVMVVRQLSLQRVRQMMKMVEQEVALQKERTRIAEDMHDELGARFTQISLLGELSRNAIGRPGKAHDYLGQISHVAQVGVKSLDEIVWAVNPRNDTLPDLLDYTGQYALDFVSSAGLQCRLDFPDAPPPREISGDIRHAVFLIVKEALHNVVKHAQATSVKIIFELAEKEMRWRIEDDGKGFEQAPDNPLDDGLRNIRQRASALGGQVEIKSRPGAGTQITLQVPLLK